MAQIAKNTSPLPNRDVCSDWERVVVIWAKGDDDNWRPAQVLLSQHSGYQRINWADVQNSFPTSSAGQARGGPNGIKNEDHLKVYVASYKHDHHQERNTGFNDVLSQLTDNAFRSQDWWYFPTQGKHRNLRLYLISDLL